MAEELYLNLGVESVSVEKNLEHEVTVQCNGDSWDAIAENNNIQVTKESNKIKILGKIVGASKITFSTTKTGVEAPVVKELPVTVTEPATENIQESTTLNVSPESISMKEGDTQTLNITTNAPNFSYEIDDPNAATLEKAENALNVKALKMSNSTITIKAKKGEAAEVIKKVSVVISSKNSLVSTLNEKEKEYLEKSKGVKYIPTVEDANKEFLEKIQKYTNSVGLKMNQTLKVSCVNRTTRSQYTKNYPFNTLLKEMAGNKIGAVRFVNDERATSAIAFIRDLTKETYGSELTLTQKIRMIRAIMDGHNIKL